MTRVHRLLSDGRGLALLFVVTVAVGSVVVVRTRSDLPGSVSTPRSSESALALTSTGPRFDTVEQLGAASDWVLVVTITQVGVGRTIADPSDPTVGITTQFATATIERTLAGTRGSETVIIEQEATLLDGTPITVNGLGPLQVGDRGVAFVIDGDDEAFPYVALVNEQGWRAIDGDRISSDAASTSPLDAIQTLDDLAEVLCCQ